MPYPVAPLPCRPWTLNGISPQLIESHYQADYGAAVARLNALGEEIEALDPALAPPRAVSRLREEQAAALNSVVLHELYFASLGGDGRAVPEAMAAALARDFGSVDRWRREFMALAEGLGERPGWVLLASSPAAGRLFNLSVTETGSALVDGIGLLALDLFEHAFHLDFGANRTAYTAAFMRNIDWAAVQARLEALPTARASTAPVQPAFADLPVVTVEDVDAMLRAGAAVQIIDARPRHYAARSNEIMDGAVWRDPERIDEWIGELSPNQPVVAFCAYGFHIGCETASKLRDAGFDARYMAGGHAAWKAARGALTLFPGESET